MLRASPLDRNPSIEEWRPRRFVPNRGGYSDPDSGMVRDSETFNEYQQRRLRVACQHIDGLLSEIEAILSASVSKSPFPKYIADIPVAQRKRIEHGIARMRPQLLRVLERNAIEVARRQSRQHMQSTVH